jgi:hypothetical protein
MLAIIRVQRMWRAWHRAFADFGPSFFTSSSGLADHGQIAFHGQGARRVDPATGTRAGASHSQYMIMGDRAHMTHLVKFLEGFWNLQRPDGSSKTMALTWAAAQKVAECVIELGKTARCWFFTGACDIGVAQLVADALAMQGVEAPVIGLVPLSRVHDGRRLQQNAGSKRNYRASRKWDSRLPLNANHTHFILLDSPSEGSDINFRARLENFYHEEKRVPVMQLAIQGGTGTLATITSLPMIPAML